MENINIELEEMRQQLDVFKKKLDNQNIINDAVAPMIHHIMGTGAVAGM